MKDLTPSRESLNPIEIASRDEIAALQLQRLKKRKLGLKDEMALIRSRILPDIIA